MRGRIKNRIHRRILPPLLMITLLTGLIPVTALADTGRVLSRENGEIIAIEPLEDKVAYQCLQSGEDEADLILPRNLKAVVYQETEEIQVDEVLQEDEIFQNDENPPLASDSAMMKQR